MVYGDLQIRQHRGHIRSAILRGDHTTAQVVQSQRVAFIGALQAHQLGVLLALLSVGTVIDQVDLLEQATLEIVNLIHDGAVTGAGQQLIARVDSAAILGAHRQTGRADSVGEIDWLLKFDQRQIVAEIFFSRCLVEVRMPNHPLDRNVIIVEHLQEIV